MVVEIARSAFVVEGIPEACLWLTDLLRKAFGGIEVAHADDLKSARRWLASRTTDGAGLIALVDLGLPDGSGVDLIRELRAGYPTAQVIVTTIYDDDSHLLHAIAAGGPGHLLKEPGGGEHRHQPQGLDRGGVALSPALGRASVSQSR